MIHVGSTLTNYNNKMMFKWNLNANYQLKYHLLCKVFILELLQEGIMVAVHYDEKLSASHMQSVCRSENMCMCVWVKGRKGEGGSGGGIGGAFA